MIDCISSVDSSLCSAVPSHCPQTLGLDGSFISLLGSAVLISASMALFPLLFQLLGLLENFKHPRALMFITLIRSGHRVRSRLENFKHPRALMFITLIT